MKWLPFYWKIKLCDQLMVKKKMKKGENREIDKQIDSEKELD